MLQDNSIDLTSTGQKRELTLWSLNPQRLRNGDRWSQMAAGAASRERNMTGQLLMGILLHVSDSQYSLTPSAEITSIL